MMLLRSYNFHCHISQRTLAFSSSWPTFISRLNGYIFGWPTFHIVSLKCSILIYRKFTLHNLISCRDFITLENLNIYIEHAIEIVFVFDLIPRQMVYHIFWGLFLNIWLLYWYCYSINITFSSFYWTVSHTVTQ